MRIKVQTDEDESSGEYTYMTVPEEQIPIIENHLAQMNNNQERNNSRLDRPVFQTGTSTGVLEKHAVGTQELESMDSIPSNTYSYEEWDDPWCG